MSGCPGRGAGSSFRFLRMGPARTTSLTFLRTTFVQPTESTDDGDTPVQAFGSAPGPLRLPPGAVERTPAVGLFRDINGLKEVNEPVTPGSKDQAKYHNGFFGRVAKHKAFEYTTTAVVMLNALEIGYSSDYSARFPMEENLYDGPVLLVVAENAFLSVFTLDLLIRFLAYRRKIRCLADWWFVFDFVLVALMALQTWFLPFIGGGSLGQVSILRIFRIARIARMARVMRAFPQFVVIVHGLMAACKAVMWTAVLSVVITYTWAIIFTSFYHQGKLTDEDLEAMDPRDPNRVMLYFGSMGKSMSTLLVRGTFLDDVTACTNAIRNRGEIWMLLAFLMYVVLNSFTIMNMLIGILVEVVGNTSKGQRAKVFQDSVRSAIRTLFDQLDGDHSGCISRDEFLSMKRDNQVMRSLQQLGIKEVQFDSYVDLLFRPDDDGQVAEISFEALLDCICRLQPGMPLTMLDAASFKQNVKQKWEAVEDRVDRLVILCGSAEPLALHSEPPSVYAQYAHKKVRRSLPRHATAPSTAWT